MDYTGKLEKSLSDIQKGKFTRKEYLNNIMNFIWNSVNLIKSDIPRKINTESIVYNKNKFADNKTSKTSNKSSKTSDDVLGKCPACGGDVKELIV